MRMKSLSVLILLLLHVVVCNGFLPLQDSSTRRPASRLNLFHTGNRVKKFCLSIKERMQKKETELDEDQEAFASAVQEQLLMGSEDDFQIAVHCTNSRRFPLIGNYTVTYASSLATLKALKDIDESYVLADIPTAIEHPPVNQNHTYIVNGHQVNGHHPNRCEVNGQVNGKATTTTTTNNGVGIHSGEQIHARPVNVEENTSLGKDVSITTVVSKPATANNTVENNTTMTAILNTEQLQTPTNLYSLPPLERQNLTKLELEFRSMLEYFCQFTEADLYTLRDPRVRAIMEGVISGSNEYPVYRAFEILYEDLPPLRVAGRMIFAKLKDLMKNARAKHEQEVQRIAETTGLPSETVEASRLAFLTLSIPTEQEFAKDGHYLTVEQLIDSGLAEKVRMALGHESSDEFIARVNETGKVTFSGLMEGLQAAAEASCAVEHCDPAAVLQEVVQEMEPTLGHTPVKQLDKKRQDYSDQYDRMVQSFKEWDDIVPEEGRGRRLDVLRGCFVGAANDRVVEALRVVYLDYAALRVAGNSIYALMKQVVAQIRRNRKSKDHRD